MNEPTLISLKKIQPNPYQPRTMEDIAATTEIAINISRNGLLQIPLARAVNGHYELVFGHTRKAAYELLATKGVPTADIAPDTRFSEMPLYIHELDNKQMFEMAVAENLKRRNLNVIEKATAMQRYMNEFGATSKQAAELFGGSDATVRGEVRFLELPVEAQDKLVKGEITQGTARTLLSMKRVTSDRDVAAVLKKIEKNDGQELPEETIESFLDDSKNVVNMWDQNGEPRGGHERYMWPLDMRNFPNNLLPQLSKTDIKDALPKGVTDHLQNPPVCTVCPFYTKIHGSHYCGNKLCHTRKTQAWQTNMIIMASKSLKIEPYKKEDGKYVVLESSRHRSMFDKRDKSLRLISVKETGHEYQYFSGVEDDVFVVCVVGEGIARLPKHSSSYGSSGMSSGRTGPRIEYAEIKARQLYKEKRQVLIWDFTATAMHVFDACAWPILRILDDWERFPFEDEPPADVVVAKNAKVDDRKADYTKRAIIWKLVECDDSVGQTHQLDKLVNVANQLTKRAASWGVKFPKNLMKQAVDGDREVDALLKALRAKKAARVAAETAKAKKAKK